MMYPLFKVHIDKRAVISKIETVIDSGFINEGLEVTLLTKELSRILRSDKLILTNSCTSALTIALRLVGSEHACNVVTTPMTCVATNTPIVTSGADIIWADINPETGMPTPESIERSITSKTRAVVIVAWAGTPPDMRGIRQVCNNHKLPLILDAAHAFGAEWEGQQIHELADYTCYSFQAIKHFTTGDGGALICKSEEAYQRAKSLKWFGLDRDHVKNEKGDWKGQQWDSDIFDAGYKFNMNNIAAAIGLAQIDHIDSILKSHRNNALIYDQIFQLNEKIRPLTKNYEALSSHWVYTVRLDKNSTNISRNDLLKKLNDEGVMAGVVHVPNDQYAAFDKYKQNLPGVREFSENQFSLPCGWWLKENDILNIAEFVINNVL